MLKAQLFGLLVGLMFFSAPMTRAEEMERIQAPSGISRDTIAVFNEGASQLNSKDYAGACEKFARVLTLAPDFAEAHLNYGTSLQGVGQFKEALSQLQRAAELKPELSTIWYSMGTCYQNIGRNKEAVGAYQRYIKLDPHGQFAAIAQSSSTVLETELKRTVGLSAQEDAHNYIAEITQNGAIRWPAMRMPIHIYIDSGLGVPGYQPKFENILRQAFQDWVDASGGRVKISFTSNPNDAAIKCNWTDNAKELSTLAEGGQAVVVPDNEGVRNTKVTILTVYPMSKSPVTDNYLRRVCLHEVGHAFGLYGHSRDPEDVMFCTIRPGDQACELSARDKNTMLTLYSMTDDQLPKKGLDTSKVALSGDPSSPLNRSITINAEGVDLLKQKKFDAALAKFEQSLKVYSGNEFVQSNIAVCYAAWGADEANAAHYEKAEELFKKAAVVFEKSHDKEKLILTLKNLSIILRRLERIAEAEQTEAQVKALQ